MQKVVGSSPIIRFIRLLFVERFNSPFGVQWTASRRWSRQNPLLKHRQGLASSGGVVVYAAARTFNANKTDERRPLARLRIRRVAVGSCPRAAGRRRRLSALTLRQPRMIRNWAFTECPTWWAASEATPTSR